MDIDFQFVGLEKHISVPANSPYLFIDFVISILRMGDVFPLVMSLLLEQNNFDGIGNPNMGNTCYIQYLQRTCFIIIIFAVACAKWESFSFPINIIVGVVVFSFKKKNLHSLLHYFFILNIVNFGSDISLNQGAGENHPDNCFFSCCIWKRC